jgi:predicted phosphoadenosine phosphosulfate sulfurtransferase
MTKPKAPKSKIDKRVQKSGKGLRIMRNENVLEMARKRMRWLFREFDGKVMVSVSGGKDSTVIFELALEAATELGMLPLHTIFIDQEAEWRHTIDTIEVLMNRPGVKPLWLQVPIRITNGTSSTDQYLDAWSPEKEDLWVHPRHPMAITQNVYGTDRFYELFTHVLKYTFGQTTKCVSLSGMRAEEAPIRRLGFGFARCYKWLTWGGWVDYNCDQYLLSPIYDWSYTDVWKAIHSHGWHYNPIYDAYYQWGLSPRKMRVSHLHHENAVTSLFMLQELEPETYERLVNRIGGIHMAATLGRKNYFVPKQLPFMFESWREYRDYLLSKLVPPESRPTYEHRFYLVDRRTPPDWRDFVYHAECNAIVLSDLEGVAFVNATRNHSLVAAQAEYVKTLGPDPWAKRPGSSDLDREVGAAREGSGQ